MTPEELIAKAEADLAAANDRIAAQDTKIAELDAKINPPVADPDLEYKPKTWKENQEKQERIAEETSLRILKEAEEKKEAERKRQEEEVKKNEEMIEAEFKKLEEEKIIEPSTSKDDLGGRQRAQILGSLVRSGGQHVAVEAKKLKSLWDQGMEYDYETNSIIRAGTAPSSNRDQFVGSSAARTPAPPVKGPISTQGVRGDLDEAQRRWEAGNGKI